MIRERIVEYLDSINVSKYRFYKETGLSNGFLDGKGKSIGTDKCEIIISQYPDLSLNWLITGKGHMSQTKEAMSNEKVLGDYSVIMKSLTEAGQKITDLEKKLEELRYTRDIQKKYIEKLEAEQKRSKSPVRADNL